MEKELKEKYEDRISQLILENSALLKELDLLTHFLDELKDKNLACWCKLSQPCHVDVLLEKLKSPTPAKPDSLTKGIKPISADELLNGSETGGRLNGEV